MVIYLDVGVDGNHLWPIFPLGLFRPTTVDIGAHLHWQPPTRLSRHRIRFFWELAPDHGPHDHHLRALYALGLLSIKTVADE